MKRMAVVVALVLSSSGSVAAGSAPPNRLRVPSQYPTIRAAMVAAEPGDGVLVSPGVYTENLDFAGKAVAVFSAEGPARTIIDGGDAGPVVAFRSGEDERSRITGFTIRNGNPTGNTNGGGIVIDASSPVVSGNVIRGNVASSGGGISVTNGRPDIRDNVIARNRSGNFGGGIYALGGRPTIRRNLIFGNQISPGSGGSGGGISLFGSDARVRDNVIQRNTAQSVGGGIDIVNSSAVTVVQNLIVENSAGEGGGLWWTILGETAPTFLSNTIADNEASVGDAMYTNGSEMPARFEQNILDGRLRVETDPTVAATVVCEQRSLALPVFSVNNLIGENQPAAIGCGDLSDGGNLNFTPQYRRRGPVVSRYALLFDSPLMDAGPTEHPLGRDLVGSRRVVDGDGDGELRVDIGAIEVQTDFGRRVMRRSRPAPSGRPSRH